MTAPKALRIYAGPTARAHLASHGLQPADVGCIPAAAGGPKGLILGRLDRLIFGDWLAGSQHTVDLVGASIGAWRMATACMSAPVAGFERLERDYIGQHYEPEPGRTMPSAAQVSARFGASLQAFYGGRVDEVLNHPRYRLHIITSHGRHVLHRDGRWRTPLGYAGAFMANAIHRRALGGWLERVVFSTCTPVPRSLPFSTHDIRTRQLALDAANFMPALQASCSIPFALLPVSNIPGAPAGCYWDGGITDYHMHLHYRPVTSAGEAADGDHPVAERGASGAGLVLYPHFQQAVVPGWLDKSLKWRHRSTAALHRMVVLAPNPDWVRTLPNAKRPDRTDFTHYGQNLAARMQAWNTAVAESQRLADEFARWLECPDMALVQPL
jgi:hypothetical protein